MIDYKRTKLGILLLLLPVSISLAENPSPLPSQFTLSRYIPIDFWFVANTVPNPKSEWIRNQWWRVAEALAESGFDRDLVSSISALVEWKGGKQGGLSPQLLRKILRTVHWRELLGGEVAVAERTRRGTLEYEYVLLTRSSSDAAKRNMTALVKIFLMLSETQNTLHLTHRQQHGIDQWMLRVSQPVHVGASKFRLTLLRKDDIVGLIFGARARKQVLLLIQGKPHIQSILQSPRFREALSQVDAPEDGYTYFDARMLVGDLGKAAIAQIEKASKSTNDSPAASMAKGALKLIDVYDYTVTSIYTDGKRQHIQTVACLQKDKKRAPLTRMIYDRPPLKRFDRYIPKDAVSFYLQSNVNFGRGYYLIRHFVAEHVPNGEDVLSKIDNLMDRMGFDIDRDILSWLSGETLHVTLPASAPTPMSQYDNVFFVRVKDPEVAFEKVNKALSFVTNKLRDIGQPVFIRKVDTPPGQCCEIVHPLLAMVGRPAIGVVDDWLYISNSVASVNRCVSVARGEAPSVLSNERFRREGLLPPVPVRSISFTDKRYYGEELAQWVNALSQLGSVVPALLLKHDKQNATKDIQGKLKQVEFVTHIMAALSKLPAVFQEINFYSSEAGYSTFDGQYHRIQNVITYREPTDEASLVKNKAKASP